MDIKNFMYCAKALPDDISVLIRGDHGIGKSKLVRQLGVHFTLPVIDKRLSQLSEGDMIGLPKLDDNVTRFCHPDWFVQACKEPVILFLDELNRATGEVMQAGFQIVLDRELNGMKLHPQTRVYAAINSSANYQVNDMDPALLDRFWTVDLEPTVDDWLEWAKTSRKDGGGEMHPSLVSFIQMTPTALRPSDKANPGETQPSPRSYERLNAVFAKHGFYEADLKADAVTRQNAFLVATGFIGNNVANQFTDYLKNLDRQVNADDILNKWDKKLAKKIGELGQEKWNICIEKIVDFTHKQALTADQAENLGEFAKLLPGELLVVLWTSMAKEPNQFTQANIKIVHPYLMPLILPVFGKKPPAPAKNDTPKK